MPEIKVDLRIEDYGDCAGIKGSIAVDGHAITIEPYLDPCRGGHISHQLICTCGIQSFDADYRGHALDAFHWRLWGLVQSIWANILMSSEVLDAPVAVVTEEELLAANPAAVTPDDDEHASEEED